MFIRTRSAADRSHSFVAFAGAALAGSVALLVCQSALAAYEVVAVTNGGTIDARRWLRNTLPFPIDQEKHRRSGLPQGRRGLRQSLVIDGLFSSLKGDGQQT